MIRVLKQNLATEILDSIAYLKDRKQIPQITSNLQDIEISLEIPKNKANGDLSSNIALKKSKDTNLYEWKLSNVIVETLKSGLHVRHKRDHLWDNVNVAKPGFINFHIKPATKLNYLCQLSQRIIMVGKISTNMKRLSLSMCRQIPLAHSM